MNEMTRQAKTQIVVSIMMAVAAVWIGRMIGAIL